MYPIEQFHAYVEAIELYLSILTRVLSLCKKGIEIRGNDDKGD
ncbi:hypothetical protein QKS76_gp3 [Cryphonectria parasitica sclerotimonavirus 1]|uniref:Uncharacterized protein n=1 Tax=Cryphonectria parasitica sclerotimonavirus 1 TaxID=2755404 RepID=A0AAE7IGC0_9MONO|nr:hypothetical protein QKS76_gp3 [Cryphonectria parasitica sclerotimonavirus 1]QMP84019.1 hypothetical protein [Cryphonectria parasitica sclerotimonavirus 1]